MSKMDIGKHWVHQMMLRIGPTRRRSTTKRANQMKKIIPLVAMCTTMAPVVSVSAYDCLETDPRAVQAIEHATARGKSGSISDAHCGAANIARALVWNFLQCLNNDPTLSPRLRRELEEGLESARGNIAEYMKGFRAVANPGESCNCWSSACAD